MSVTKATSRQFMEATPNLIAAVTAICGQQFDAAVDIINEADPDGLAFIATVMCGVLLSYSASETSVPLETATQTFALAVNDTLAELAAFSNDEGLTGT